MNNEILNALVVIVVITLGIFLYADSNYWKNEVTVYTIYHNAKTSKDETMIPTTYKTLNEKQVVVHWVEGFAPSSYEQCAIRDYKNWKCDIKSSIVEPYEIQMLDGKLTDSPLKLKESEIVPKWKWWLVRIQEINLI